MEISASHSQTSEPRFSGMRGFMLVCLGQFLSMLGSAMTVFALSLWAWEKTGQVTALSMVAFFSFAPMVVLSPVAGALVDRWDRKRTMMMSDAGAGLSTLFVFILYGLGLLEIWHLFVASALAGAFMAFQFPAYSAAMSLMIPKGQLGRANGMLSMVESASGIMAPIIAAFLVGIVGLSGILSIDLVTCAFAILTLALIHVPQPKQSQEASQAKASLWKESLYGFVYIWRRPSLLGLQLVFLSVNLLATFSTALLTPFVLARSGNDPQHLSFVMAAGSVGSLAGGAFMSIWGGPKRRVYGVIGGMIMSGIFGYTLIGIGPVLPFWMLGSFLALFCMPILNGSNQAIWQSKVPPDLQGRVFSTRRLIAQASIPIAMALVGPLADNLFEPMMQSGQGLAQLFAPIFGTGQGAGIGLLMALCGILSALAALIGFFVPSVRYAEDRLPDY
jgi:DHA3 family macrolide efflux protein-like MFS transporter